MAPHQYRQFVILVASPWLRRAREPQDREDIIAAGLLGIVKALARFDALRGCQFETYASHLVRGEVQGYLRHLDLGRRGARLRGEAVPHAVSCECLNTVSVPEHVESQRLLEELLATLPVRERFVVEQRHLYGRHLTDIAADVGVCPSRISQICSAGMSRMREVCNVS